MKLQNIGVIGAGTMGNGIAQTCAIHGYDVVMQDISDDVVQRGLGSIQKSLGRLLGKEKISQGDPDSNRYQRDVRLRPRRRSRQ